MIDALHITDIALIQEAHVELGPGLVAITGETGAGKTALLGALKLLIGQRGDVTLVRDGAASAQVEGRFFTDEADKDGVVVKRTIGSDGRSRASINGSLSSVKDLAQTIGPLVDLVGQHEHQSLLKVSEHARFLDAWGDAHLADAKTQYNQAFQKHEDAKAAYAALIEAQSAEQSKIEQARYIVKSVEEVQPQPHELEQLEKQLAQAQHFEALQHAAFDSYDLLNNQDAILDKTNQSLVLLEGVQGVEDSIDVAAQTIKEALYLLEDASANLRSAKSSLQESPSDVQDLRERINALQGLMHTWGPTMTQVLDTYAQAKATLEAIDKRDEIMQQAMREVETSHEALVKSAHEFTQLRKAAAEPFAQAVMQQLSALERADSVLKCNVEQLEEEKWTHASPNRVEFLYCPGKNMQFRPLSKIASGGEISRVLLAIKVILGNIDNAATLVFDEVDAGVGGSTAKALAQVLASLAKNHQVIVVTHLPQVAAKASRHISIHKDTSADGSPISVVESLDNEARVFEIARMLAGDASATALEHARELLNV